MARNKNCFSVLADNRIYDADITVSRATVSTAYGENNIKHYDRSMTAKWDAGADLVIDLNFPDKPIRVDTVIFSGLVMSVDGTASFTAYSGQNQSGDIEQQSSVLSTGGYKAPQDIDWGIDHYGVKYDTAKDRLQITADESSIIRSARITISDPGNIIELRHLLIGERSYFESGYEYGASFKTRRNGDIQRVYSGFGARGKKGQNVREFDINMGGMTSSDASKFIRLIENFGDQAWYIFGRPWDIGLLKEKHEFLCLMESSGLSASSYNRWSENYKFIEV